MTHQQALKLGHTLNQNHTKLQINCNKYKIIYIINTIKHVGYISESPDFNPDDLCLTKVDRSNGWNVQSRSVPDYIPFSEDDPGMTSEDSFLTEMESTLEKYDDGVIKTYESGK